MQAAALELEPYVHELYATSANDKDKIAPSIWIVDGILDATPLVAILQKYTSNCPKIFVYMHENQLTTPFTQQDRDQRNKTHWHYGVVHWRSLMVTDGFLFNSRQHLDTFAQALPKLINQQCPRDTVDWHLQQARQKLKTHCTVLWYGLQLEDLRPPTKSMSFDSDPPVVLWNARLEEDKDPETFFQIVHALREAGHAFRLIVLGSDPSRGTKWYARFQSEFSNELLFIGWCEIRSEYCHWLAKASVVISTAIHETFGVSVLESVWCGALPLLPRRLSYPEIFPMDAFAPHFYSSISDCVEKLAKLFRMTKDPTQYASVHRQVKARVSWFCWSKMAITYDAFFKQIAAGTDLVSTDNTKQSLLGAKNGKTEEYGLNSPKQGIGTTLEASALHEDSGGIVSDPIYIVEAKDPRVALYRPKSVRDHAEYHKQLRVFEPGIEPTIHGGRRGVVRMLEAVALGARMKIYSFLTTRDLASKLLTTAELQRCENPPVYIAEKETVDTIRGQKLNGGDAILTLVDFPMDSPLNDLIVKPPILILEDVRYADNIGSILRTAFCLGITSVVATRTAWAALRDSRAARCSMGTMYYHRFFKVHDGVSLPSIIDTIRKAGITIYGIEIDPKAKPVSPHGSDRNWAAILGNEDAGMMDETRKSCDTLVFVPQAHGDSMNVGHAAAITLFELGRNGPTPNHDGLAQCT